MADTKNNLTRRTFLMQSGKGIAGAALGTAAFTMVNPRRVAGANDRVHVALIGSGSRGRFVARQMIEEGAVLTHFCDLSDERLQDSAQFIADVQERKPELVKDMRQVLDSKEVDAVIIGTPDHWHALATVLSCQAGKDVYVEKPQFHNIWEGRKMIEAVRKYDRVCSVGTQNRSGPYNLAGRDYVRTGKLGKICLVKVYNLKPPESFRLGAAEPPPPGFDWDAWLGPAPERPYHKRIWYNKGWQHLWDFCNGEIAIDGIHQMDLALMLLDDPGMPKAVSTSGGRFMETGDDSEIPDVLISTFDFDKFTLVFVHGTYPRYMRKTTHDIRRTDTLPYWTHNATRIEYYGSELMMTVGRMGGGWQVTTSGGRVEEQMYGRPPDYDHVRDFLACVKSRKRPTADVEILHTAGVMTAQAAIAYRVGNQKLYWDAQAERFLNSDDANGLLKRKFRAKYEVPEKV